jgi:hypothetical protein
MANPFYVQPADPNQGLKGILGGIKGMQDKKVAAQKQQRDAALMTEAQEIMQYGTPQEMATFSMANPELGKLIDEQVGHKNDRTKKIRLNAMTDIISGVGDTRQTVRDAAEKIKVEGGDPSDMIKLLNLTPEEIIQKTQYGMAGQFPAEFESLQTVSGGGAKNSFQKGTIDPNKHTIESLENYEASGDVGDLVRNQPKVIDVNGIKHIKNEDTLKWEPVVDIRNQEFSEQSVAAAEFEADKQSRLDFGKDKSKFESNRPTYLNSISAAEQKQTVIRNTADKIKDLMGSWNTKYGAMLSALPATEARTLKGLIDTMKANSAFTTLTELKAAGGTLGAISEAELNLLERAWGALDQGGDSAEFERVLNQLVDQNSGSLARARNAFDMNKKRYSGSYDDSQRQIQDENTVKWDEL